MTVKKICFCSVSSGRCYGYVDLDQKRQNADDIGQFGYVFACRVKMRDYGWLEFSCLSFLSGLSKFHVEVLLQRSYSDLTYT